MNTMQVKIVLENEKTKVFGIMMKNYESTLIEKIQDKSEQKQFFRNMSKLIKTSH